MEQSFFDPEYEFNAPHFYDFSKGENSGEGDSFFDNSDEIFQPSPEKPVKGKNSAPVMGTKLMNLVPVTAPVPKPPALTTALRTLQLTDVAGGNKDPKKPEMRKDNMKVPNRPRFIRQPSPTVGVKKCKPQSPTKPKCFSFQTDQRARLPRKRELFGSGNLPSGASSMHGSSASINSAPKHGSSAVSNKGGSKVGFAKAVSQENVQAAKYPKATIYRRSALLDRRSVSTGQLSEKQPPVFKVPLVPAPKVKTQLPPSENKSATHPRPLSLRTNKVFELRKEKVDMKKSEEQRRKTTAFHARPMPDFNKTTCLAKAGDKCVTAPTPILLHIERRAEKRKVFEIASKKREEIKEQTAQREIEKRRKEQEEIRKLRQSLVHRPLPIKMSKPLEVKRGTIAPTKAEAPKFQIEKRLKERSVRPQQNGIGKL